MIKLSAFVQTKFVSHSLVIRTPVTINERVSSTVVLPSGPVPTAYFCSSLAINLVRLNTCHKAALTKAHTHAARIAFAECAC